VPRAPTVVTVSTAVQIEAADSLEQRERRDLIEIVERLGSAGGAPSEAARKRQEALDQGLGIATPAVLAERSLL
jgi:uncharacterized protein with PIN domain